jgi:hypothetical protein
MKKYTNISRQRVQDELRKFIVDNYRFKIDRSKNFNPAFDIYSNNYKVKLNDDKSIREYTTHFTQSEDELITHFKTELEILLEPYNGHLILIGEMPCVTEEHFEFSDDPYMIMRTGINSIAGYV